VAITLTQLNALLALVRTGSVTAAAEELVVTQPSVSVALSALSREVGAELTEKAGRNVRLSRAGEAFAPFAAAVVGLLEQGRSAAREAIDAARAELRVAAVTTAGEYVVPPLLRAFVERHPGTAVTLEVGNRHRVLASVREHRADIGIAGRPPAGGGIAGTPFLRNEIVVITAPDDPLAARRSVALAKLGARTWLVREEGSGTRAMVEEFLARAAVGPPTVTLGSNGAIKSAVAAGLGISLQSRAAVELELAAGALATIAVRPKPPVREWYVLRSDVGPAGPVRPIVEAFLDFVLHQDL
jgi:DNA-binding transcriptional LysR family regulator